MVLIIKKILFNKPDLVYFTLSPISYAFYRDAVYVFLLKLFNLKLSSICMAKALKGILKITIIKKFLYLWVFKNTHVICLSQRLTNDFRGCL